MEMICINCPMGCMMTVEQKDGEINVKGNGCKRGIQYAIEECTAPTRMLTSSVYVTGGSFPVVPVKTERAVPKEKLFEILQILKPITCTAPIEIGEIIVENVLGLGLNIIATKSISNK
ncbi:MAG: DUF1667 domain-containing protein [Candidatus Niameybacter stercoravium]|nr:DUF1667 domain-containing protein [Candidatus Niameybacter stercoravium]